MDFREGMQLDEAEPLSSSDEREVEAGEGLCPTQRAAPAHVFCMHGYHTWSVLIIDDHSLPLQIGIPPLPKSHGRQ